MSTESDRLRLLHELELLEGEPAEVLRDLVELAASLCSAPVASISILDEKSVFFLAAKGIAQRQLPRELALCHPILREGKPIAVNDTLLDERYAHHPLVQGPPGLRFYQGYPVSIDENCIIGALCVADFTPRQMDDRADWALRTLAKQVSFYFTSRKTGLERAQARALLDQQRFAMANAAKLSSLGEMAANIAHEINNPLAAILSRAGFLIERAEGGHLVPAEILNSARAIETTSLRISKTVRALRSFARDGDQDPESVVEVSQLFDDTLELCQERFRSSSFQCEIAGFVGRPKVRCRPVQIVQVLLNLMNNAYDAAIGSEEKWVKLDYRIVGDQCEMSVANGGPRLAANLLQTITKPFYTTKPAGQGTGLGLSISERILNQHGTSLKIDPEAPRTRFYFHLPQA